MPFVGVPVVKLVTTNLCRITGVSVDAGPTGTIGLAENFLGVDILLPAAFKPRPYDLPDADGAVALVDAVQVTWCCVGQQATIPPLVVVKDGATLETFTIGMDLPGLIPEPPIPPGNSGAIEIYIRFHT